MRCEAVTGLGNHVDKVHRCWQNSYPKKTLVPYEKKNRSLCRKHRNMVLAGRKIKFSRSTAGAFDDLSAWR